MTDGGGNTEHIGGRPRDSGEAKAADIRIVGAEKTYPTGLRALDKVDLDIRPGEFIALLGPSGCGKSTMLRMIGGLDSPTAGEILVGHRTSGAGVPEGLGMVFQEANLFPWFNISENVALPLRVNGVRKRERSARAKELCELLGIGGFERSLPRELSGGMRQRAAIARALIDRPSVLLADEPFGALDALTRDRLNLELQRLWLAEGFTTVFVTHSISEAVFLADRVVLMTPRPGKIDLIIDVPFDRPRDLDIQSDPQFQEMVLELRHRLERAEAA